MKINRAPYSHRLCPPLAALLVANAPFALPPAAATPTTATIRFTGTDFEGRQNFQVEWHAEASGTYLVQSADSLSSGTGWQTIDSVTSSNAGPVKWMAPEVLHTQKFYRLILPQPQIFSVEPGVVDTTVSNQFLYLLGQGLPTNADVVIDGVHFTPELVNSNGVWARISLNGLPPGEPVLDLTVIDLNTTNPVADFSHPFFVVDSSSPYLLEPPSLPPAAPQAKYTRKSGAIIAADYNYRDARRSGEVCDDGNNPEVMAFSGEVQQQVVDLAVPGRGLDFIWARTYRSRTTANSSFGTRWTCSYDVRLQPLGGDIVIHDGTGRADTYFLQTNSTYACPGFFREGTLSNGVFRLVFADGGIWEFNPLDGSATAGTLAHLMNGNGDVIKLNYDGGGRLVEIVDDLDRTNTVAYNSDGQAQSVTDFSGRTVTYAYYQSGETGGSVGDLKSVTSPPVTGTPNGNDFPDGKTTTYTYSSGYKNDLENHLLLSVIDPLGQTVCQYIYQHNQTDLEFLHCTSVQRWTNTPAMLSYLPQTPSSTNQFAVMRCVLNDSEGDVSELFFDARNRCVAERDFTGRAAPGVAVTDVANRPTGKLRSSDPDFYETRWTWNDDSRCTKIVQPDGSSGEMVYQRAFNQNSSRSNHTHASLHDGDLRVLHEYPVSGQGVDMDGDGLADAAERTWSFEYDPRFGTCEGAAREYNPTKGYLAGDTAVYNDSLYHVRSGINDWSVGDWAVFNGTKWEKVDNSTAPVGFSASIADTTGPFDPNKWNVVARSNMRDRINQLENSLKNIGLLVSTIAGGPNGNGNIPVSALKADKVSGATFGHFAGLDASGNLTDSGRRIRPRGWDGTIKGRLAVTDCDDNDPKRHHPTAALLLDDFVTSSQDPRGNVTTAEYDAQGNRVKVKFPWLPGAETDFAYDAYGELTAITNAPDANGRRSVTHVGWQFGHISDIVADAGPGGLNLTNTFEHDARGNVTRCVDPRGNDWLYTYNALDQCVRCESPTNLTARCVTDIYHDGANNVQAAIVEVRDDTDTKVASKAVIRGHDRLHRLTQIACDVDATHAMTNRFVYNGNDLCVQVLGGDAVSGVDPHQVVAYEYDERGLLFREITAPGSPLAGTNEFSYTAEYHPATKKYVDSGDSLRVSSFSYDGFNRLASITDPMGNQMVCFFDANDNLKSVRCFGETNDVPGPVGNLRLAETRYDYDGLDRCIRVHELHFDPATQVPVGDGEATTSYAYAPDSECVSRTNDLGHVTTYGYDTAGQLTSVTSPNTRTTFAILPDRNGNGTNRVETDLSDLGGAPQVFSVASVYDSQNRCVQTVDNAGNTNTWAYDSLGRCVKTMDARGTRAFYAYDLLDRCTMAIGDLDGDGFPDFTGDITETAMWSSSSDRLLSLTDSHTNTTSYAYDTLGNCTNVSYADGTQTKLVWSPRSNLIQAEDANGSVVSNTYDLNDRIIHRDLAARTAIGVAATTTFETYTYDGCSRLTSHHDDDCDGYLSYDSLGNCTGESLNGLATHSSYDSVGNRLSLAYPGGRSLNYTYDALERCIAVAESGKSQASYSYDGPDRVSRVALGNNTVTRIFYDGISGQPNSPGDHGWQEIARVAHGLNGGSAFADSSFQYDSDQNKIFRSVTIPGGSPRTNVMTLQYDLADRLIEALVTDNSSLTRDTVYGLDRIGNRTNVIGAACSGDYTLDGSLLGPLDFQMNQYTTTPCDSRTYDDNGNLVSRSFSAGPLSYIYDAADRLVAVQTVDSSSGVPTIVPVADYRYDALGRRISKTVYSGGTSNTTQFLYDGAGVIEERENGAVAATFVLDATRSHDDEVVKSFSWKQVDGPFTMRRAGQDYYYHTDDQGNTLALTGANGAVFERYEYDDYGAVTFLTSDGTPTSATSSAYGNVYLFGGLRYDAEAGLHNDDGGSYLEPQSARYMDNPMKSARMSLAGSGLAGNNPWSGGGGGGGGSGGAFSERTRDYLYEKFQNGDIPEGPDSIEPRDIPKSYFETGDKPTQSQFGALIDSAVNLIDDRKLLGLRTGGGGFCGSTDHLIVARALGQGAFGRVYRSRWQEYRTATEQLQHAPRH